MKNFFNSRLVFIFILIIATASVVLIIAGRSDWRGEIGEPVAGAKVAGEVSPDKLKTDYEQAAKALLLPYFNRQKTAPLVSAGEPAADLAGWQELADKTKSQLLDLRVPEVYKELHLQLVLDFDQLGRAATAESESMVALQKKISDLVTAYPWLNQ